MTCRLTALRCESFLETGISKLSRAARTMRNQMGRVKGMYRQLSLIRKAIEENKDPHLALLSSETHPLMELEVTCTTSFLAAVTRLSSNIHNTSEVIAGSRCEPIKFKTVRTNKSSTKTLLPDITRCSDL